MEGVCFIGNKTLEDDLFIMIIFNAKLINENIKFDKEEILDVKWFDYNEIVNNMDEILRGSYVKTAVMNQKNNLTASLDIVNLM